MDKLLQRRDSKRFPVLFFVYAKIFFDNHWEETGAFTGDLVMKMSEKINELATALVVAQGLIQNPTKSCEKRLSSSQSTLT
jgi:hypothetical protein